MTPGKEQARKGHRKTPAQATALRRGAEARLEAQSRGPRSAAESQRLLHELRVHQIELEMQNEELQRARAELETELRRYADLCDFAPVGYLTLQLDGAIRQANLTVTSWLGIERSRLLQRRFSRFIAAEDRSVFEALVMQAFETKAPEVGEVRLSIKGRPPLPVQLRAWVSGDGQECRVVLTDFSERKRAEAALREARDDWKSTFDGLTDLVTIHDRDFNIIHANSSARQILGLALSDILTNAKCFTYFHGTEKSPEGCSSCRSIETGQPCSFEFFEARFNRHLEIRIIPRFDTHGQCIGLIHIARDITERKRSEAELITSSEQLRALAARLQAVREEERARVAREIHDVLAQELTRLKMDVVWLDRRLARPLDADKQKIIRERLAVMTAVTDTAIQSVQKIATELRPVVLDSLGLSAAVEWQVWEFQTRTGLACTVKVPEHDAPLDRDRSTAMFRVLQESLTNVLRHAQATQVDVCLRPEAEQLVLQIQDDGCGISPEALANPMSIGLVGMRERALLLDGQLEIRSQPELGTTIEMRLPFSSNASQQTEKP